MSEEQRAAGSDAVLVGETTQPQTALWLAVGRKLLEDSVQTGRDYARYMIQTSFGGVPIYITLLRFVKGEEWLPVSGLSLTVFFLPPMLFLLTSLAFITAYFPRRVAAIVGTIEGAQQAHEGILRGRRKWNVIGTILFFIAMVTSTVVLM